MVKTTLIFILAIMTSLTTNSEPLISNERISRSSTIYLNGSIDVVFPLFGPIMEKEWAHGWNPEIIFSVSGDVEEHMIFRSKRNYEEDEDYTWVITQYNPHDYFIEYTISTSDRIWFITVLCNRQSETKTSAKITYTFTALTEKGIYLNRLALDQMYKHNLKDWEKAINHYLQTGTQVSN